MSAYLLKVIKYNCAVFDKVRKLLISTTLKSYCCHMIELSKLKK